MMPGYERRPSDLFYVREDGKCLWTNLECPTANCRRCLIPISETAKLTVELGVPIRGTTGTAVLVSEVR